MIRPTPTAEDSPRLVLVMGVSGSGKSTLGKLLAERLAYTFLDADDFHDDDAIARMHGGEPLTDGMRDAWVDRLELALRELQAQRQNCVLAFSGLRARHRRRLMRTGFSTTAFMLDGSAPLLTQRLGLRADHFMPASQLPDQLASMEPVGGDENIETIDVSAAPGDVVAALAARLQP